MDGQAERITPNPHDRLARLASMCDPGTKICPPERPTAMLEAIIEPGDHAVIEGDNKKQADREPARFRLRGPAKPKARRAG